MTRSIRFSNGSSVYADFLAIQNAGRPGRSFDVVYLPRYSEATVDSDGSLRWPASPGRSRASNRHRKGPQALLRRVPASLCFEFAKLEQGSDAQIRRFASLWGPLGKELGIPQKISEWRTFASIANAILRFVADRGTGGKGRDPDWATLWKWVAPGVEVVRRTGHRDTLNVREQLGLVAGAVNKWFQMARGNGIVSVDGNRLAVRVHASNLFGILIMQIAYVVSRSDQAIICSGCAGRIREDRPRRRGIRQYCETCRKRKVPQRDAARDYRRRKTNAG